MQSFRFLVLATMLALLPCDLVHAAAVVLYPGHIEGSVTTAIPGYQTKNIHVSATGGGYSASNNSTNSNNYSLTVQTGDWNTDVTMNATVGPEGQNLPSTYLHFEDRTLAVAPNSTVSNNYHAGGTVRFNVFITGDAYNSWSASGYASKTWNNNKSYISASSSTDKYTADASWEMPAMAASQMSIGAGVTVNSTYGSKYYQFYGSNNPLLVDIADGEILDVDLYVNHVAPADPGTPPPPPPGGGTGTVDYGALDLTAFLDMNVDGQNYNANLAWTPVYCGIGGKSFGFGTATNTGHKFFPQVPVGDGVCGAAWTRFKDESVLYWPGGFFGGVTTTHFTVAKDQTTYVNVEKRPGRIEGELRFTGAVTNADLSSGVITFSGVSDLYDPVQGWLKQLSEGGYTEMYVNKATDWKFTPFAGEGLWNSTLVGAYMKDNSSGFLRSTSLSIYDNRFQYDGSTYDFGQNIYVTAGQTTYYDREYCLGKATVIFRSADGGLLSKAYATSSGTKLRADGKTEMRAFLTAWDQVELAETPELVLYGPEMTYELADIQVYTQDGSLIRFTPQTYSLECGATKVIPVPGPVLSVTAPASKLITNATSATVAGTAGGDLPLSRISVNSQAAPFSSVGTAAKPNEVAFAFDLALAEGINTILTEAVDTHNIAASDQRQIMVDRWVPVVTLVEAIDNTHLLPGMPVNLVVNASDRGYGFNLKVYVDGILKKRISHTPVDDASWEAEAYQTVLTATAGGQVITLEANDLAGNIASYSFVVKGNTPPVLAPLSPVVVNEGGVVEVSASAVDPEGGLLEYAWDLDNDGIFETAGQTVVFSAAILDGPGQATIAVKVTDNGGLTAQSSAAVTILNVGPVADFANTSGIVSEGGAALLTFRNASDPGTADVAAGFSYSYDCNGDNVFELSDAPAADFTCSYADNGIYSVSGIIRDKDGAVNQYSTTIEVTNIAPLVGAITVNPSTVATGSSVAVSADFSDPGLLDTHTATWSWGDGAVAVGLVTETAGAGAITGSYLYSAAGSYTITLTVSDNDGGVSQVISAPVTVTASSCHLDDDDEDDNHGDDHGSSSDDDGDSQKGAGNKNDHRDSGKQYGSDNAGHDHDKESNNDRDHE